MDNVDFPQSVQYCTHQVCFNVTVAGLTSCSPARKIWIRYSVFPEPLFSGGQLTPSFENRGSIKIFEGQLGLTPFYLNCRLEK